MALVEHNGPLRRSANFRKKNPNFGFCRTALLREPYPIHQKVASIPPATSFENTRFNPTVKRGGALVEMELMQAFEKLVSW